MCILTLAYLAKIPLGLFSGEPMMVNFGKLLVDGSKSVTQIWDAIQMSGWLLYPFVYLYHSFIGSYDGIILFVRVLFVVIQLLLSLFTWRTLCRVCSSRQAQTASVAAYLFVFNYYTIYYKNVLFWGTLLTVLLLIRYQRSYKIWNLILAAVVFFGTVLCYPTIALLIIPFTRFLLHDGGRMDRKKKVLLFWSICAICALLFLMAIIQQLPGISLREFLNIFLNLLGLGLE